MIAANDVLCRVYAEIPSKTIGQIVLVVKILFDVLNVAHLYGSDRKRNSILHLPV